VARDPTPPPHSPLRSATRWAVAGAVGAGITLGLFVAMSVVTEGTSLLERVFRLFPLIRAEISTTDECAAAGRSLPEVVPIAGTVGTDDGGGFRPLADAQITGRNAISDAIDVEVDGNGTFRFATSFPSDAPSPCAESGAATGGERQQLVVRAPGCAERRVPVTRAWVAHRVLLDCANGP
jgi:hypothetical protein